MRQADRLRRDLAGRAEAAEHDVDDRHEHDGGERERDEVDRRVENGARTTRPRAAMAVAARHQPAILVVPPAVSRRSTKRW